MSKILFIWMWFLPLFYSCDPIKKYESIEDKEFKNGLNKVLKRASFKLKESECIILRLDTLTKFDWDRMYAIKGSARKEDIERQLGMEWEFEGGVGIFTEGNLLLVFVKNKKIVSTVKYLEGDPSFESFSIGVLGAYAQKSNAFYYIYKQFYAPYEGFYLKLVPIEKKQLLSDSKWIDSLRIVPIDDQ